MEHINKEHKNLGINTDGILFTVRNPNNEVGKNRIMERFEKFN